MVFCIFQVLLALPLAPSCSFALLQAKNCESEIAKLEDLQGETQKQLKDGKIEQQALLDQLTTYERMISSLESQDRMRIKEVIFAQCEFVAKLR